MVISIEINLFLDRKSRGVTNTAKRRFLLIQILLFYSEKLRIYRVFFAPLNVSLWTLIPSTLLKGYITLF